MGGLPCRFLKIDKKCPVFGKFTLFMCIYGLNSHLKDSFKSVLGKKHEIFPCGCLLFYGVLEVFIKVPYPKKPVLSWKVPGYAPLTLILTFHPNFHPNIWVSANLSIYKELIHDNMSLVFWKQRIFSLVLLLRRSKIIFINVVLILPITVITSLILKLHWLSTVPDKLRIGS